jgi:hypothetical protein
MDIIFLNLLQFSYWTFWYILIFIYHICDLFIFYLGLLMNNLTIILVSTIFLFECLLTQKNKRKNLYEICLNNIYGKLFSMESQK